MVIKRAIITECIAFLYVLLFVYAALSKLFEYEKFRVQISQSPFLAEFSPFVPWLVITIELVIAGMLIVPRARRFGFRAAFNLMTMFTVYIIAILNFSSFVPCSCGGVLEKLGWTEHLIFNIAFILLALLAILLDSPNKHSSHSGQHNRLFASIRRPLLNSLSSFLISICVVGALMYLSNDLTHHRNSFLRQFPPHVISNSDTTDLQFNSYYIAGGTPSNLFLGNYTAPLHVLTLNSRLDDAVSSTISVDSLEALTYKGTYLKVDSPMFYLYDGITPSNQRGKVNSWEARPYLPNKAFYADAEPINDSTLIIRTTNKRKEYALAVEKSSDTTVLIQDGLLQKQIDGRFCVDGMLLHNKDNSLVIYLYYYRNQYLVLDERLNLLSRFNTIDTITTAQIKPAFLTSSNTRMLAAPPLVVNKKSCTWKNFLFVNAGLMAKNESKEIFENSAVIDVYNIKDGSYRFSFYLRNYNGLKLNDFAVIGNRLFAVHDRFIIGYDITEKYFR